MIAQSASMDVRWSEVMPQGKHWQQWRITSLVTKVITELTAGKLWTAVMLSINELSMTLATQVMTHKGKGDSTEV